ncbi:E3 ubiquitin-protein ligase RHF2A-like protein [Drosera capensis]
MEAVGMDQSKLLEEAKLTSAAAFVEGGIQDACDDACSICLEEFCESDPSTVTGCKHEFHLQCILEWCQRSSQCPMCWQPISLKDPASQELLDAVVQERNIRFNPPRSAAIFHHPSLGDFEIQHVRVATMWLQWMSLCSFSRVLESSNIYAFDIIFHRVCRLLDMQLPVGVNDAELEERIIQHLAAAAAMGRARHIARREGHRNRSSAQGRPHLLLFSSQPSGETPASSASPEAGPTPAVSAVSPSSLLIVGGEESSHASPPNLHAESQPASTSITVPSGSQPGTPTPSNNRRSPGRPSPRNHDKAGPSDLQSFSEALKSRFNEVSARCKESISKGTRGWKERWFSRNSRRTDLGSDMRREVNAGIPTVSRMMENLETQDNVRTSPNSLPSSSDSHMAHLVPETGGEFTAASTSVSGTMEHLATPENVGTSTDPVPNSSESSLPHAGAEEITEAAGASSNLNQSTIQATCGDML